MKHDNINPDSLYWASFNRFEMRIPGQAVIDCSHTGPCDDDVARWVPKIIGQCAADNFKNQPTADKIRAELKEYGAWDETELADDVQNWNRIVWIACNDISENASPDSSEPLTR